MRARGAEPVTGSRNVPGSHLDREYDLRAAFPDYVRYFEDWRDRSRRARECLPCLLNVPYGEGSRDRVDFFPAMSQPAPLLVYVHGGYWRSMDKSDFSFVAIPFVKRGVSLALINYDLFPGTTMSSVVGKVRGAYAWVVENAGNSSVRWNSVHLAGWSAGAHLAAMIVCAESCSMSRTAPISSLLALSGIYDLRPILQTSANGDLCLDQVEADRNSPIHLAPPDRTCPVSLMWGANETGEFRKQSSLLADVWRAKGADLVVREVPNAHHYDVMDALADEDSVIFRTAVELLRLS